jgi:phosphatidate cytidylyltransferase
MKRVLTALVLIPLVLLAVFKAPSWLFTLLVGTVAILALREYLDLVEAYGVKPIRWLSYIISCLPFLALAVRSSWDATYDLPGYGVPYSIAKFAYPAIFVVITLPAFLALCAAMRSSDLRTAFPSAAYSVFGVFFVAVPLSCLALLHALGPLTVIFTFFAVWAGDIVAMYTGKAIGRHKMSPRVSPNKTWEGAIGSLVGSIVVCSVFAHFVPWIARMTHSNLPYEADQHQQVLNFQFVFAAAILLNIAAQLGDLVESLIKRGANVKDSGTMLPGHGGILDRIDALLFAAPVALILFEFVR